jgi:hypothetical protein
MTKTRLITLGAFALVAAVQSPLGAQGSNTNVQLAFGYECGDRFLVRNEGTNPVALEYSVAGSQDKSQLHLNGQQSAEIASAQTGNVELYVGGKVVASEPKGNRACGSSMTNGSGVTVRPLDQSAAPAAQGVDSTYVAPPVVVYAQPDYYYPYADYYPYSYYGYGYSPYFYPSIGIYGGGFGRGYIGGRGFVGRGGISHGGHGRR